LWARVLAAKLIFTYQAIHKICIYVSSINSGSRRGENMRYSEESLLNPLILSGQKAIALDPKGEMGIFIGKSLEGKPIVFNSFCKKFRLDNVKKR
jgi:hypothetical protein